MIVMNPGRLTFLSGWLKCGVLVTLKASTRASRFTRPIGKRRKSPKSMFHQPGPRTELRPVLPKRTSVTEAQALAS